MATPDLLNDATQALNHDRTLTQAGLASTLGIGRATLHRHYPTRDALIHAIAEEALTLTERALHAAQPDEGPALEALDRVTLALLPLGHRYHFLLTEPTLDRDPDLQPRGAALEASLHALLTRARDDGTLRADVPAAWYLETYGMLLWATWNAVHAGHLARLDAPRVLRLTFIEGLGSRP
ncbi:AcrR family transcriptional regulator [Deinococcus metalli]|uniref:AcrR family transcriptional regulator n=1 Tax=Deinococcus metalli TaxID=1141878 RepID=A0A7W8NQP5_9DEIO|nr:hypothetical protein [Deinococcus metalli]MBB5378096.1 AcrR family transcriptional regulator [Deinococcus metalli]GHF54396.1 TetR family transcriptional regulator [Deinococcus metalli]